MTPLQIQTRVSAHVMRPERRRANSLRRSSKRRATGDGVENVTEVTQTVTSQAAAAGKST